MSTLFLDDSKDRWQAIKPILPSGTKWVKNPDDCITQLSLEWDLFFIDHDLENDRTGMEVVDYIIEHEPIIRQIIIHSVNPDGSKNMLSKLRKARYQTMAIPFPSLLDKLRKNT